MAEASSLQADTTVQHLQTSGAASQGHPTHLGALQQLQTHSQHLQGRESRVRGATGVPVLYPCSKMKKGSYLVNTARGKICDRDAVVEALRTGHLAGGRRLLKASPVNNFSTGRGEQCACWGVSGNTDRCWHAGLF